MVIVFKKMNQFFENKSTIASIPKIIIILTLNLILKGFQNIFIYIFPKIFN